MATTDSCTSTVPCNLCEGTDVEQVGSKDRHGHPLRTVICRGCGLVFTDPRPTPQQIRTFYAENYRVDYKSAYTPKPKHAYRETLRAMSRVEAIQSILNPQRTKLLDVGCGGGFFLYALTQVEIEAQGIEPNKGFADYAVQELSMNVQNTFLQDADFAPRQFDIVTVNHVLEHVEDPCKTLGRLADWIRIGGYLVVEVPNVEATYHAPRNRYHIGHLYNFNPHTLEKLGQKAGLNVYLSRLIPGSEHLHVIFQRPAHPASPGSSHTSADNYQRVKDILQTHTTRAHYTSLQPYLRLAQKQWNYLQEWRQTRNTSSGREIVDQLAAHKDT